MELIDIIKRGGAVKINNARDIVDKEIRESRRDLKKAKESFEENDYKWCIIASYYSMFHILKALMLTEGLREKSHSALIMYLDFLLKKGHLEGKYKNYFIAAKEFRERADYSYEYSKRIAVEVIEYAEEFNNEIKSKIAQIL